MTEIWKSLEGFSKYKISNTGKIWSNHLKREISLSNAPGGYIAIRIISDEGVSVRFCLHRLVALGFIPNPENKTTVNHINYNTFDNRVENLEWATQKEQNKHQRKSDRNLLKLGGSRSVWRCSPEGDKLELYKNISFAADWLLENNIAKSTKCNSNISAVCRNKRKMTYGYKWVYHIPLEYKETFKTEIWKYIPKDLLNGKEGYKISDYGRVQNTFGRITSGYNLNGYKRVTINKKNYQLHRLVAQVFLPNYYGKPIVNHKDHDKSNSKLYNLEWVTHSQNNKKYIEYCSNNV
tara:strand:- start:101 stop:979 length:879 start_codon:yes stop_codon:yes gene_type:complete